MACCRYCFCDLISTSCAGLFSASFFCASLFLYYGPIAVTVLFLRKCTEVCFITTYWTILDFCSFLCTCWSLIRMPFCILINCMSLCFNGFGDLFSADRAFSLTDSSLRACRFYYYCPVAICMVFLLNCKYTALINRITDRAMFRFRTFFCTGCFFIN